MATSGSIDLGVGTGGIAKYSTFLAFPSSAANGSFAVALDTDILYVYSSTSMAWEVVGGTSVPLGMGTLDGVPPSSTQGAVISGNLLWMQSASGSEPGLVNLSAQTLGAGVKTFTSAPVFSTMTPGSVLFAGTSGALSQNNSKFFWDNSNGCLVIGSNSSSLLGAPSFLTINNTSSSTSILISSFDTSAPPAQICIQARGSIGSPAALQTGDFIYFLSYKGYGNTGYRFAGQSYVQITDPSPSDTAMGGNYVIQTTRAGTVSPVTAVTINSDQTTNFAGQVIAPTANLSSLTAHGVITLNSSKTTQTVSPGSSGNVLRSNGTDWVSGAATVGSMGALDGTSPSSTNGAVITGGQLFMQSASGSEPGLVNLSAQTLGAGVKTFTSSPIISTLTSGSILYAGASGALSQDNANLFWDDANGGLVIGYNDASLIFPGFYSTLTINNSATTNTSLLLTTMNSSGESQMIVIKARGTPAAPTTVATGDFIFFGDFKAYGNTNFQHSAQYFAQVTDPSPSDTSMAGAFGIQTTPVGSINPLTAVLVNSDQTTSFTAQITAPTANLSSLTGHGVVTLTSGKVTQSVSPSTSGNVLTSNGTDWISQAPTSGGSVTSVSVVSSNGLAGTVATATTTPAITLTTTVTGILKGNGTAISAATTGDLTDVGTDGIVVTSGTGAVLGSGTSIAQHVADTTHNGYLNSTDWNTFNGKTSGGITALTGDGTASGPGSSALTLATVNSNVGSFTYASLTVNAKGLITAASSGTAPVTSLTVASANGFAGSSSGGATPALTLTTTINSPVLAGNGTAISAATTTGSGAVVLATSPTLVTPALGTPSSLVGTNITGTAASLTSGLATAPAAGTGHGAVTLDSGGNFQSVAPSTSGNILTSNGTDWISQASSGGTGTVTSVSVVTANGFTGTVATSTSTPAITLTTSVTGILQGNGTAISAATTGNLTDSGTDGIVVTSGTGAVLGSGTSLAQHVADATHNGYLSSTDWNTFNSAAGGGITSLTGDVTGTGPGATATTLATVNSNVGSFTNSSITVNAKGLITAASSGTAPVTSITVASSNGFAGSSSGGATPILTLSTSINSPVLAGNGTAISAATTTGSGSTVVLATSPTLITPALGTPSALVGTNITGTAAGLTAGNVTTNANLTGVITSSGNATSIASQTGTGTKFVVDTSPTLVTPALGTPTALVGTNITGTAAGLTAGLATAPASGTGHGVVTLTAGAAFQSVAPGSSGNILSSNGTDWISSTPAVAGTVTSVSVVSANGFTGSVATATTTPAITLTTSINSPVLAGNGTALIAATTTGSGSTVALATSPVFVTPALGTPSSGVMTSVTGLPLTTGVTGILPIANGGTNVSSVTIAPTASSFAGWDASSNLSAVSFIPGYATTAMAGGTTVLTVASKQQQYFTGSSTTAQTVTLPVASTLALGMYFEFVNITAGTGSLTVNSSGGNLVQSIAPSFSGKITCILTSGTTAASWQTVYYANTGAAGANLSLSNLSGVAINTALLSATTNTIAFGSAANVWSNAFATQFSVGTAQDWNLQTTSTLTNLTLPANTYDLIQSVVNPIGIATQAVSGGATSGSIYLYTGNASSSSSGSINLKAGNASSASSGGDINITAGASTSGTGGNVILTGGGGGTGNGDAVVGSGSSLIPSSDNNGNIGKNGSRSFARVNAYTYLLASGVGSGVLLKSTSGSYTLVVPTTVGSTGNVMTSSGVSGTAMTWTQATSTPTASVITEWDANVNLSANSVLEGYTTTVTAAGTTTLTVGSTQQQYFTGSTTQTAKLPVASTLVLGQSFTITNLSSGTVTVQSSGANTIQTMTANTQLVVTCILASGTGTASWNAYYSLLSGGTVTSVALSVPTFLSISGSPITSSGTLAITLSGTALPIANGGTARTSVPTTAANTTYAAWDAASNLFGTGILINGGATATNALVVIKDTHVKSTITTPPTVVVNSNAGTGATSTLSNATDIAGTINLTTTAVTSAAGVQTTITFNKPYNVAPICVFSAANSNSSLLSVTQGIYFTTTTTTLLVNFANADLTGNAYVFSYHLIETQ